MIEATELEKLPVRLLKTADVRKTFTIRAHGIAAHAEP